MTEKMRACLEFYSLPPSDRPTTPTIWNNRQLHAGLDAGHIHVGSHGYHETTDAGRAALSQ